MRAGLRIEQDLHVSKTMRTIAILALFLLSSAIPTFAQDYSDQTLPDIQAVEPAQGRFKLEQDSWAYKSPSTDSDHLKEVHAGHQLIVTGATRDFVQVHLKDGSTGYVPLAVVAVFRPAEKTLTVSSDVSVYAGPHLGNAKLARVQRGQSVHVIGVELYYLKIRTDDGVEGFIPVGAVQ